MFRGNGHRWCSPVQGVQSLIDPRRPFPAFPKIPLVPSGKSILEARPSRARSGGADASSRTWSAGCDGRRLCRPASDAMCGRRSRVVLAPRRWRQVGGGDPPTMVTRKPDHQREHEATRKPIAQGMPERFGEPVVTCLRAFFICTRGCGCVWHPAFPAPSVLEGHDLTKLGQNMPRECSGMSIALPRHSGARAERAMGRNCAPENPFLRGVCGAMDSGLDADASPRNDDVETPDKARRTTAPGSFQRRC